VSLGNGRQCRIWRANAVLSLGDHLHAWWRCSRLRQESPGRIGKQEKEPSDYKLYVAEQYVSKEYMNESERRILDSIRDLPVALTTFSILTVTDATKMRPEIDFRGPPVTSDL
jgi:hypothetical protein